MSKPISERMLTCSALLYSENSIDEDRNIVWSSPVELSKIFIVANNGQSNGNLGKSPSDTMSLYYDCFNSRPLNVTWKKGQKISFNGVDYFVNSIDPVYSNGLHHYEIGLR